MLLIFVFSVKQLPNPVDKKKCKNNIHLELLDGLPYTTSEDTTVSYELSRELDDLTAVIKTKENSV